MANNCYNHIEIIGDEIELLKIYEILNEEDAYLNLKQHIEFTDPSWFMFDIHESKEEVKEFKMIQVSGDSAWSPALSCFKNISAEYPKLHFKYCYEEGGADFAGYAVIQNGHAVDFQYSYWEGKIIIDKKFALETAIEELSSFEDYNDFIEGDMFKAFDKEERLILLEEYKRTIMKNK